MSTLKMPKISKPLSDTEIKNAKYTTDEEFELLKKELEKSNSNEKADNKKSKELQEEWLKKNRVNKVNAF